MNKIQHFSTVINPPTGFLSRPPTLSELHSSQIVIYTSTLSEGLKATFDQYDKTQGLIVTLGMSVNQSPKSPCLWHLTITENMISNLAEIATTVLEMALSPTKTQSEPSRKQEELITSVFENIPGAVYQFYATPEKKMGLNFVGSRATEIFGISSEENGFFERFTAHVHPDDREMLLSSIDDAICSVSPWDFEGRFIKPNGETMWFRGASNPSETQEGLIFNGILLDITDRKIAEQKTTAAQTELLALRNYLSNIIDAMPSILICVDEQIRITLWNHKAQQETGIDKAVALGAPLMDIFPSMKMELSRIEKALVDKQVQIDPKRFRETTKGIKYESVIIFPLINTGGAGNRGTGAVIRIEDITKHVKLEEMMVQSEKMLSIGGLAAGMAHEINNPLAGMLQTARVIYDRLYRDMPANHHAARQAGITMASIQQFMALREIPRMLEAIDESGHRVRTIIHNILGFARKGNDQFSKNDLSILMDQTLTLAASDYNLSKNYDFKQIKIVKSYETDLPLVPCDPSKIQQVFMNILKNGAEAMHHNRSQTSPPPQFHIYATFDSTHQMVRIDIEDNGPGMDVHTSKRVFEPFYTTKDVGAGTGLGLSVSYFIIAENHSGNLSVNSVPNKGTTFTIQLPVTNL